MKFTGINAVADRNEVQVSWTVSEPDPRSYFIVEGSSNSTDFEEVNVVKGNPGNSFNFIDREFPAAPVLYYRITQCSFEGSCQYSKTVSVKINNEKRLVIYPVPAGNNINVSYSVAVAGDVTILINNKLGQTLMRVSRKVSPGSNTFPISISLLPAGSYTLIVANGNKKEIRRFLKR